MKLDSMRFMDLLREELESYVKIRQEPEVISEGEGGTRASFKDVIRFPTVKITEAWGDPNSEDRKVLEKLMKNIGGNTVQEKLESINSVLTYTAQTTKINKIFSHLMFTEIFWNIMQEYNASTTGFLFEAFLAGVFGGETSKQIADKDKETGNLPIVDAHLSGVPYSIKVLSPNTPIKGSFKNLVNHFTKNEMVKYLVVTKEEGDNLLFHEFEINRETFFKFIGYSPDAYEVKQTQLIQNVPGERISVQAAHLRGTWGDNYIYTDVEGKYGGKKGQKYIVVNKEGEFEGKVSIAGQNKFRIDNINTEPGEVKYDLYILDEPESKRQVPANTKKLYGDVDNYDRLKKAFKKARKFPVDLLTQTPGYRNEEQFLILSNYIRQEGIATLVGKLDLSEERLKGVWEEYAKQLQNNLIPIYETLAEFTSNTNSYFLGTTDTETQKDTRKAYAVKASANAATLKSDIDKLT